MRDEPGQHQPAHGHACCGHDHAAEVPPQPHLQGRTFKVSGLDCAEEVAVLKRELGPFVGGEDRLAFDVLNGRMTVADDAKNVSDSDIAAAVKRTGMAASRWQPGQQDGGQDGHRQMQIALTTLSGLCLLAAALPHFWQGTGVLDAVLRMGSHDAAGRSWFEILAYLGAIAFGVRYVLPKAWFALRRLRPDINLLMVIAIVGAIGIGEWLEAATVAFLFSLSLTLESWSVGRARRAISALLDLAPATVHVLSASGEEREVAAAEAPVGTRFVVRPGERIGLDGRVISGSSAVDQAPITGESVPVTKEPGAEIFAGTINGDGALEALSTKAAEDTTLARITRMVEEAHSRRARAEQWVEKFARVYTPAVIALAVAVFVVPPALFDAAWGEWFYRALVLLVIACPCALVISTPVSIVAALAASARHGVLVKGGTYLEQPARLEAIAFDKTGTLTRGEPAVVGMVPLNGHSEEELLERAAALEARSTHPLARAVVAHGEARGVDVAPAEEVQILQGKGVVGRFRDETYWLGSHRYLVERGQANAEVAAHAAALEEAGRTVVVIGNERHVCGLIAVADTVRPEAPKVIGELRAQGIGHLIMLTGDNRATAQAIAGTVGVDEVRAELLPEDKVAAVEELVSRYGTIAMVGDGVNDAPAMARASFGIAMGAAGSDAAIETADIALMTDDLSRLPWLVGHSRRTLRVIRENIAFSLGIKALFVVLTFAGYATLWGAIAADVGASLLVVMNALRLLRPGEERIVAPRTPRGSRRAHGGGRDDPWPLSPGAACHQGNLGGMAADLSLQEVQAARRAGRRNSTLDWRALGAHGSTIMLRAADGPAGDRSANAVLWPRLVRRVRRKGRIIVGVLAMIAALTWPAIARPGSVEEGVAAYERADYEEALQLFKSPAEEGDPTAQFYLGLLYLDGAGVAPDSEAATRWFKKAAVQGHAAAQFNLGVAHYDGQGVTQSFAEAALWFRRAAEQEYGPAAHNLAAMYADGLGLDPDPDEALRWYERAAHAGVPEAMHELAAVYFSGRLGPSDPVQAYMWLLLAMQHGDEDAAPDRLVVERSLSRAEIQEAEARAARWTE